MQSELDNKPHSTPYDTILHYIIVHYIITLYYTILHYIKVYYVTTFYIITYYITVYYKMILHYTFLCYVMLCYIILCYIVVYIILSCINKGQITIYMHSSKSHTHALSNLLLFSMGYNDTWQNYGQNMTKQWTKTKLQGICQGRDGTSNVSLQCPKVLLLSSRSWRHAAWPLESPNKVEKTHWLEVSTP